MGVCDDLICSSREKRFLRLLRHGRATCTKRFVTVKKMQHNMGLCCTDGQGGGGGSFTSFFYRGRLGKWLGKSEDMYRKGL